LVCAGRAGGGGDGGQRGDLRGPAGHGLRGAPARRGKGRLAEARLEEVAAVEVGRLAGLAASMLGSGDGYAGPRAGCSGCGRQAAYAGCRDKTVTTVLGPVTLSRAWYHCAECKRGFAPHDQQLGISRARCRRAFRR
jgi:hypothetical protein